jgi:hypothetical protein
LKQDVRKKVKGSMHEFYPEVVLSYASGRRLGDAEGTGPGFVHAFQVITLLEEHGIECFSGLHVPAGGDWKSFYLRLIGDEAKPKVFIALLDYAYFQSIPCMKELHLAIRANVQIVLVRMEEYYKEDGEVKRMPPPQKEQWKGKMDEKDQLERMEARECVATRNAIPHPGTLLTIPKTFDEILSIIRDCKRDPPTNNGIFESHSSSEQAAKSAQVKALAINLMRWKYLRFRSLRLFWRPYSLFSFLDPPTAIPPPLTLAGVEEIGSKHRCRVSTPCFDNRGCSEGAEGTTDGDPPPPARKTLALPPTPAPFILRCGWVAISSPSVLVPFPSPF